MDIDTFLPKYHFSERHEKVIPCTPFQAYNALLNTDFSKTYSLRFLFALRGLKSSKFKNLRNNFAILSNEPPRQIILGLVARPWKWKGDILPISPYYFTVFNESDYAKMVWVFTFDWDGEKTIASTETRIYCTDKKSKRKFGFYWFFIKPFSGLIRREILRLISKNCHNY